MVKGLPIAEKRNKITIGMKVEKNKDSRKSNVCLMYFKRERYPRKNKGQKKTKTHHTYDLLIKPKFIERLAADIRIRGSGSLAGKPFVKCHRGFVDEKSKSRRSDDWFLQK